MNVLICGVGGQGVILFSDLLSNIALAAGLDVKKSEVHGMDQRGVNFVVVDHDFIDALDDLDDPVDRVDGGEQTEDDVEALLRFLELEAAAPGDDLADRVGVGGLPDR